jgi:hypothetical protein
MSKNIIIVLIYNLHKFLDLILYFLLDQIFTYEYCARQTVAEELCKANTRDIRLFHMNNIFFTWFGSISYIAHGRWQSYRNREKGSFLW